MDLSKLKWVLIAAIVIGGGWLVTEGGVNWVYKKATEATPGTNPEKDKIDESTLSRYGGFLLSTFRYEKAKKFYQSAIDRYPDGDKLWWNYYQMARCEEKLYNYQRAADILHMLWTEDADQYDERVPGRPRLKLRLDTLIELNDLERYDEH
ncbi:MAG: tetratricopeptide repeat protein [Candidatus Hydrogenedentes bacterium]|nr:tetratricopeptide repeat protein [Candidatus Hydrogenedentota bacterium]